MGTYLINFIVYSMAMAGLLFVCLCIYKKTMLNTKCMKKNDELSIENALSLSQRKTLYVIKAGNEKFLIAADTERTSFLAKLDEKSTIATGNGVTYMEQPQNKFFEKGVTYMEQFQDKKSKKGITYMEQHQEEKPEQGVTYMEHLWGKNTENNKQAAPVISQTQQVLPKKDGVKRRVEEEKETIIDVKRVDYSEVMSNLRKNSAKNKPVMKEMIRKLAQPIFEEDE